LIAVGRELEIGWLPPLITQSRNAKIHPGRRAILTRRSREDSRDSHGQITRAMGDVHPSGNPHYWLDPATAD
jgi:zinc/manganese transport system substrate-binding protein